MNRKEHVPRTCPDLGKWGPYPCEKTLRKLIGMALVADAMELTGPKLALLSHQHRKAEGTIHGDDGPIRPLCSGPRPATFCWSAQRMLLRPTSRIRESVQDPCHVRRYTDSRGCTQTDPKAPSRVAPTSTCDGDQCAEAAALVRVGNGLRIRSVAIDHWTRQLTYAAGITEVSRMLCFA